MIKKSSIQKIQKNADDAAGFLKSLANPNRLKILCVLSTGETCVTDILAHLDISQTALSQHLSKLRAEGIVDFRRDHRTLYYFIQNKNVQDIINVLHGMYCRK